MLADLPAYVGSIAAASIAGAIAFLASVLSKEQKTSEFRQAWIDSLRNDLADLASLVLITDDAMAYRVSQGKDHELPSYIESNHEKFTKIMACAMRIEMRLNPQEHQELLALVRSLGTSVKSLRNDAFDSSQTADRLLEESQRVLKREWQRVKRGENVFHYTKCVSLGLLLAGTVALLFVSGRWLWHSLASAA